MAALLSGSFGLSKFIVDVRLSSEQNLLVEPRISSGVIEHLDDDQYVLLAPIPIEYERAKHGYVASVVSANMSAAGTSKIDARQTLEIEILDAFEDWTGDEAALGPGPRHQLTVLKQYIRENR